MVVGEEREEKLLVLWWWWCPIIVGVGRCRSAEKSLGGLQDGVETLHFPGGWGVLVVVVFCRNTSLLMLKRWLVGWLADCLVNEVGDLAYMAMLQLKVLSLSLSLLKIVCIAAFVDNLFAAAFAVV